MSARRGRILVVDDERALCDAIERTLSFDHDVVVAASASEALNTILSGARFDAILSDLMMPGMTGMDLYGRLNDAQPDQANRMIFMSGGACTPEAASFLAAGVRPTIAKPFRAATLREAVNKALSEGAADAP
jgi:CheY-like chemotaxis protein